MIKAIIVFALLSALFIGLYYLNHKTPKPEGSKKPEGGCPSCIDGECQATKQTYNNEKNCKNNDEEQ